MSILQNVNTNSLTFHIEAAIILVFVLWILLRMNRTFFKRLQNKRKWLHLVFFERVTAVFIVIVGTIIMLSLFAGADNLWRALLGGTAIISAVVAFAAQDVIDDILAGLMISLYKPFEIGNRVELEDGTAGIVRDITMRHVVIHTPFSDVVIPNSKLNKMSIRNYSYHIEHRSFQATFQVAYGTDVEQAMQVILDAIKSSECTIPGMDTENGKDYAPVYFMAYEESSLRLETRVFFKHSMRSEDVISDVNIRVNHALKENGIEIPYKYINIIRQPDAEPAPQDTEE